MLSCFPVTIEGEKQAEELSTMGTKSKARKKTTPYQRRYKKAFKQVSPTYKKKDGKWKKGGFQKAVKAAHKEARGKK